MSQLGNGLAPKEKCSDFGMVCPHAEKAMAFLSSIGLDVKVVPGASGFIQFIDIVNGGLCVDPKAPASGILHDAGHLAIVPSQFRAFLSGNLYAGLRRIFEEVDLSGLETDSPLQRALLQIGDPEATAWAWAAGRSLGIPDELIIQDNEYNDGGADVRVQLAYRGYLGINGLSHAGFCVVRKTPYRDLPAYPELAFWLQPTL